MQIEPGGNVWEISRTTFPGEKVIQTVVACEGEVRKITSRSVEVSYSANGRGRRYSSENGEILSRPRNFGVKWKTEIVDTPTFEDMIMEMMERGFFIFSDGSKGRMEASELLKFKSRLNI